MPVPQIGIAATANCSYLKSHSESEIAIKIASTSAKKSAEIASEIAMIRIGAIQIDSGLDFKSLAIWASKDWELVVFRMGAPESAQHSK